MYATENDLKGILDFLNVDDDIAFIVGNGAKSWIARETAEFSDHSWYCLWHIPSGPLPLEKEYGTDPGVIEDPWSGWTEIRTGGRPDRPYFGDPTGVIWLSAHVESRQNEGALAMSGFSWIGNYWRPLGRSAKPVTEKYWNQLRRHLKKQAQRIPRSGAVDGPKPEIWAMKEALHQIQGGRPRDLNPSG